VVGDFLTARESFEVACLYLRIAAISQSDFRARLLKLRRRVLAKKETPMTRVAPCAFALVLLGAAVASAQSPVEKGKEVYTAQKCSVCHSIAGAGNKKGPLDGVGAKLSATDIRAWIVEAPAMAAKTKADRKPPMKAYTLPMADLDGLVAYMESLK
jgi:mono/diheme cytochrome c family protein